MGTLPKDGNASQAEKGLLLFVLFAVLILSNLDRAFGRTGFSAFDEENHLNMLQAWREGDPLYWRFTHGSIFRAVSAGLLALLGPQEAALYLPAQVALAVEALCLFLWLRPRLGERAALWACLADLVCSATFARGRSMLSPAWLPAVFLAHAVALDHLRRPWQHALWGFSAVLWTLDYEGWLMGLAYLGPAWVWMHGRGPGMAARWGAVLLGAGAAAAVVAGQNLDLSAYVGERTAVSKPRQGILLQVGHNLRELLGFGHRMSFSAADEHPWPAPWIWPLLALGATSLWRRFKGAYALLAVGAVPLILQNSAAEPHRFSLALLALAAMAGCGAAWAWNLKRGPWALGGLLLLGAAVESRAWVAVDPQKLALAFGRSRDLHEAARWMESAQPPEGWRLIDGIGPYHDGCFRLMLDQRGVKRDGGRPIALVHADYAPGLKGMKGKALAFNNSTQFPLILYLPTAAEAERLEAVQAEVAAFQLFNLRAWPQAQRDRSQARLRDRSLQDPWARTIYWEAWMLGNTRLNDADPALLRAAMREPLVSGWLFDVAAAALLEPLPEQAALLQRRAEMADPRRKQLLYRHVRL